jgi:succinate dehydrogenase/fumarate reductase flavoprotein subunit
MPEKWDMEVDLVSVGGSTGGLAAALVGHDLGLKTVLLEKAEFIGGGTALSGGILWVPCNAHMVAEGLGDSREEALDHIRRVGMGRHDEEQAAAYVDMGPEVVRYIEEHTPLKLVIDATPDYYSDLPGGKKRGRELSPDPATMPTFLKEAEDTHPILAKVRPDPVPFFLGMRDPWSEGRALIGAMAMACTDRGIEILTEVRARQLLVQEGRVIGLRAERDGKDFFVRANKGVLLATGGFEWNAEMNRRFLNTPEVYALTPNSNEGDGHIMGMEVGAAVALMDHSIFQPIYKVEGEIVQGKPFNRPISYGYPASIMVNQEGRRCCNESFYPDIGRAFGTYDKVKSQMPNNPLFWLSDQDNVDRTYINILSSVTPNADWLHKADTLEELAQQLGIPADNLVETVEGFNRSSREGRDPDFHRGESTYEGFWGNKFYPGLEPNPTLGPMEKAPFYGVKLLPGSVGNLGGLVVNKLAQVMNTQGEVIPGLYGTSNTTALLSFGASYTSGACQAKSLIFGYIAAQQMGKQP